MLNKNQVKDVLKLVNHKLDSLNYIIEMNEIYPTYLGKTIKELLLEKNRFIKIQTILKNILSDYEEKELHT